MRFAKHCTSSLVVLSLGLVLVAGCKTPNANATKVAEAPPVSVQTQSIAELEVPKTLRLTGTLRGYREVDLAANAAGRVTSTSVERGQLVTNNQVIAKLDVRAATLTASEAAVQVQTVRAQEEQAKKECERYAQLQKKGAISDLEYDRVMTQCRTLPLSVDAASARASLAAQNVGDGVIRAPFAGIITERYAEVGQFVQRDSRVVSLVSADPLRLELTVPEADVANVKENADVTFRVAAYPGRAFQGKIRFISGAVRSTTRDLVAEAVVDNPDKALKPGMFAEVDIVLGTQKLPSVPKSAVVHKDGEAHAFVVIENQLEERLLALGPETDGHYAILEGAKTGEHVVVANVEKLENGQRVQ